MLFIPFVENAFKHGVAIGQTSGIDIAILISDRQLIFTCVNAKYSTISDGGPKKRYRPKCKAAARSFVP